MKNRIKSIAIGAFDGMHLAHQQLFSNLCKDGAIVVIQTDYENLTPSTVSRQEHTNYPIFYYPLKNIKSLSGTEFIKLILEEFPSLEKIVVGYDFHFGHNAQSNTTHLKKIFKGELKVVDEYKIDNISVHSRIIRGYLRDGKIKDANKLLGYNYYIYGNIIKGQGLGKKQFVPTININIEKSLIPQEGIYITKTKIFNTIYKSISFIGHRVTTDGKFAVETHILEDISNLELPSKIEVIFIDKLRDNKKYDRYEDLKKQILKDIDEVNRFYNINL